MPGAEKRLLPGDVQCPEVLPGALGSSWQAHPAHAPHLSRNIVCVEEVLPRAWGQSCSWPRVVDVGNYRSGAVDAMELINLGDGVV